MAFQGVVVVSIIAEERIYRTCVRMRSDSSESEYSKFLQM